MSFACGGGVDLPSIPKRSPRKHSVEELIPEIRGFHSYFEECFFRSEPRENFFRYIVGQFSEMKRKSAGSIALQLEGSEVRAMQRFVSDATWHEELMLSKYHDLVAADMGASEGVCLFAETGFPKKGGESAGVARQPCQPTGKVMNCQVGVFAGYASCHGYALLDKRLYMPDRWFHDDFRLKRQKCGVPKDLKFRSKPQLAVEMLEKMHEEGRLPFGYVVADKAWGGSPEFVNAVQRRSGLIYFVPVAEGTLCWPGSALAQAKSSGGGGETHSRRCTGRDEAGPKTVFEFAQSVDNFFWYRRKLSEGAREAAEYEFTRKRVILADGTYDDRSVWLVVRRTLEANPAYSFFVSNAPLDTDLARFVWLSGISWAIEQCFDEAREELGMDQYEVRKYSGWNRHILTCMLAHFFLWHMNIRLGETSTRYYSASLQAPLRG